MGELTFKVRPTLYSEGKRICGKGVVQLLRQIDECHSLRGASLATATSDGRPPMSYSKAVRIVADFEKATGVALLDRTKGGNSRAGCSLTTQAKQIVEAWDKAESSISSHAKGEMDAFLALLESLKGSQERTNTHSPKGD